VVTTGERGAGIHQEEPKRDGESGHQNECPFAKRMRLEWMHAISFGAGQRGIM
jgi:hypothetical protein